MDPKPVHWVGLYPLPSLSPDSKTTPLKVWCEDLNLTVNSLFIAGGKFSSWGWACRDPLQQFGTAVISQYITRGLVSLFSLPTSQDVAVFADMSSQWWEVLILGWWARWQESGPLAQMIGETLFPLTPLYPVLPHPAPPSRLGLTTKSGECMFSFVGSPLGSSKYCSLNNFYVLGPVLGAVVQDE